MRVRSVMPGDVTWRHDVTRRHEGLFSDQTSQSGHHISIPIPRYYEGHCGVDSRQLIMWDVWTAQFQCLWWPRFWAGLLQWWILQSCRHKGFHNKMVPATVTMLTVQCLHMTVITRSCQQTIAKFELCLEKAPTRAFFLLKTPALALLKLRIYKNY